MKLDFRFHADHINHQSSVEAVIAFTENLPTNVEFSGGRLYGPEGTTLVDGAATAAVAASAALKEARRLRLPDVTDEELAALIEIDTLYGRPDQHREWTRDAHLLEALTSPHWAEETSAILTLWYRAATRCAPHETYPDITFAGVTFRKRIAHTAKEAAIVAGFCEETRNEWWASATLETIANEFGALGCPMRMFCIVAMERIRRHQASQGA